MLSLGYLCLHLDQSDVTSPMSDYIFHSPQQIKDYTMAVDTRLLSVYFFCTVRARLQYLRSLVMILPIICRVFDRNLMLINRSAR